MSPTETFFIVSIFYGVFGAIVQNKTVSIFGFKVYIVLLPLPVVTLLVFPKIAILLLSGMIFFCNVIIEYFQQFL
ncbi:hypothetical protein ICR95_27445 (plasmid) [Priestia megaterium]|uniref:hypothetical protein n=1 Tax=Priestia TaxID=2800373 RepID=UPI00196A8FD7|nr:MULTISPECIES: hypothetical protein [Priestia]QSF36306.1 hypothetical protein ICR95_27445 [Priestia megaterium]